MYTRCGEESVSLRHKFRMVSVSASLGNVFGGVGLYSRPGESFAYTAAFGAIPEGFYLSGLTHYSFYHKYFLCCIPNN